MISCSKTSTQPLTETPVFKSAVSVSSNRAVAPYAIFHSKWNCDKMIDAYKQLPEVKAAVLWNTFGTDTKCYNRMVALPNFKAIEVHLTNGPCQNNNRCGSYEFKFDPKKPDAFAKYAGDAFMKLIPQLRPDVACYVSAKLETKDNTATRKQMADLANAMFRGKCKVVDNPVNNSPYSLDPIKGALLESHNDKTSRKPAIFNNDGIIWTPQEAITGLAQFPYSELAAYWTLEDNCNVKGASFVDPRKRTKCKSDFSDILKVFKAATPKPPTPGEKPNIAGCKKFLGTKNDGNYFVTDGVKKDLVWKQMDPIAGGGNRYCGGKVTSGTTVLTPNSVKTSKLWLVDPNGKTSIDFCKATLYTEDKSNRQIWRSNVDLDKVGNNVTLHADGGICWVFKVGGVRQD